jgi:hypothetical protein
MRRALSVLVLASSFLLGSCAEIEKAFPRSGRGNPPIVHVPGKADLFRCDAAACGLIPVNIQAIDGKCTVPFLFQRVDIQPGVTARFAFAVLTPEFMFRFTDPDNDARTDDPARRRPAIDIDYRGMPQAFAVAYAGVASTRDLSASAAAGDSAGRGSRNVRDVNVTRYDVTALPGAASKEIYYRFTIHAEWSADRGATWLPCEEKDPVIANN